MESHGQENCRHGPLVSIVIPCRNERDFIESSVKSILAQHPPDGGFEVVVADGMSDDGTREILKTLAESDPRLRIVDNLERITPCGMNAGIRQARGRYIAIMGAHTEYTQDYVYQCVALLEEHSEVCCSGGPITSHGRSPFGKAVAAAMSSPVGVGNAKHRYPHYEGYAEGACFPVFRKEIFSKIGLYDENLVCNQDDDFNYRVARSGEKVFISPRAKCFYFVRERPSELFRQYYQYGYWRVAVLRKHRVPASCRQIVPVTFFLLMFVFLAVGLFLPGWWKLTAAALPGSYVSLLSVAGVRVGAKQGIRVGSMFVLATAIMHWAYAMGFGRAIATAGSRVVKAS